MSAASRLIAAVRTAELVLQFQVLASASLKTTGAMFPQASGARSSSTVPIMSGYYNDAKETAYAIRDGWLYTDDLGYLDEQGELYIIGIKKPMLITKGQNIYFSDLEDLLKAHPAVAEVAACGIPDPDGMRGEVVLVAIKLKLGMTLTEQEVKKYCLERLANYKTPKKVVFVNEIPRRVDGWLDVERLKI